MPDGQSRGFAGSAGTWQAQRAFARLEDRVLLAAQPVVEITDQTIQLGNTATVTVSFDNQPDGSPGGDVGYAPYIDLVLPKNGADGGAPGNAPVNDGVSFLGASFLGATVETTVLEFDNAGQAVHPFARDASGNPLIVRASDFGAAPGDELVVLRLPFGSFVADQPRADVSVTLQLSPLADIDAPLVYGAQGGFAYGLDPLNNPTVDPPIRGAIDSATITPNLFNVTKVFSGPEGETATGPNFPRSYTITFDLAAGQTVTDTILRDVLPDGIVVTGPPVLSGAAGTAVYDPLTHTLTTTIPGPTLGVSGAEITVTLPFYVGEFLAPGQPGTPVLNSADGAFRPISNDVSAEALWTPLDGRDPTQVITYDPPGPENTFTAKSIAVQKSQTLAVDVNAPGLGPGDTIEYTIQGQVSDYFAFGRLVVSDVLSDGQSFLGGSATLAVTEAGGTAGSGTFLAGNIGIARDGATGLSAITFNLSDQLIDAGAPDGVLTGSAALGAATFTITFRTTVDRFYVATGDAVGQGDALSNTVSAGGDVIGPGGIVTGSNADTSGSSAPIATGSISKEIYALNGVILAPGTPVSITSGDEVTFRLTYSLPQTLAAQLDLRDFLPLPVFDVTTFTLALQDVVSATPPAVDTAKWGPLAGAFDAELTQAPTVTLDAASNSVTFTFKDLQPTPPKASIADVLFTLKVADRPFGDGLLLTNQLQTIETSATGSVTTQAAIRQLTLNEPNLDITKGVVAFDGSPGTLSPTPPGPVSFTAPGSAGVRFSGVIDSTDLALTPVDSDLFNMDSGDRVTFAIVVENTGRARNGAFDVSILDTQPQGFVVGAGGLNLQVTDGAGNALAFTGDLFTTGITLTDGAAGALAPFSPISGANIVVITYDLVTTDTVQPRSQITNLASITNYAAFEGGTDRVPNTQGPTQDTATVTIGDPSFEKNIVSTSVSQTQGGDLTIGETITYELVATLREGRIRDLVIQDILPGAPGRLDFIDATVTAIGANLFERKPDGSFVDAISAPTAVVNGQTITFTFFNDIVNKHDNVADAGDQIRVRVTAVAANVAGNVAGAVLENTGELDFTVSGSPVTLTDTENAKIVGPAPVLSKTADRDVVQGGDVVTYTVVLGLNTGLNAGPAFDITATDPLLPGSLTLVAGSATLVGQPAGGATISEAGGVITVTAPVILPGEEIRFTYQARVEPSVVAGTTLPNTVAITADSFPGVSPTGVDRDFAGSATESVRIPGPGIVKTVSAADTSLPETGSALFNPTAPDLAIGEIVTYRLTVTLPEAVSTGLVIRDLLPGAVPTATINQGLFEFLSASIVRIGASLSGPGLAGATPVGSDTSGDGIADTVAIAFGDVTNTPDGIIGAGDEIEVSVTARVRDAAANVAGRAPINFGEVTFGGQTQRDSALVDIVEPNLAVTKAANDTAGDAGDRVIFTITLPVQGANAGPAFNVTVTDTVPIGFTIDTGTLGFVTAMPGATLGYDPGTRLITAVIPTYVPGSPLAAFRYEAVVDNSVRPAEVLTNTATLTFTSSPGTPADEFQRDYGPLQASESFIVDLPSMSKRVVATDVGSTGFRAGEALQDVVIGETVTYLVTLRLPEVTTNLVLTDFLPVSDGAPPSAGDMRLISASLISIGANITGAALPPIGSPGVQTDSNGDGIVNRVDWNFGTVTNLADNIQDAQDLIIVEVVARVINVPANQPGDRLINTGQAQYSKADGSTALITQTETVQIVGPELAITKTPSVPSGDAGDLVTYTVTVNHVAPPGSPASTANAFGVVLDDLLAPGLALVAGSVTASIPAATVLTGNGIGDTTIRVALEQYALSPATPLIITYQARLTDAVRPGTTLPNTADLDWQSAPTGFPDARADNATADAVVAVVFPSAIDKTVTGTSLPETPGTGVEPGETITYTITLTLGEGTQQVLLTDVLPSGLSFVSGSVTAIGSNISGTLLGVGAAPVVAGQGLSFDFGNAVVNAGDNVLDARDRITVQVTARVLDVPGNAPGTVLTNNAVFTTDTGTLTDTAPVTVVAPSPVITKGASIATGDAGDLVTFTVVVAQQAGATGPLYDLNVTDALGASYVLVAGSAVASRGVVTETGNTVTLLVNGAALLPGDDPGTPGVDESRITLTYQARLADSVQPGDVVPNLASFTGLSAPTGTPGARPFTGSDDASVTVVMPVTLDKAIVATSLPGTPGGSVSVGETITYRLTATLSEGTQTLVIADTLPAGLEVVSTAVAGIGAGVTAGAPTITVSGQGVSFDFGTVVNAGNNILGDGTVAVDIIARVRDVAGNVSGTTLTNAGTVTITAPDNPQQPGGTQTDQDNTTATVVAPDLLLDKSVPPGFVTPGEVLTYTVTLNHTAVSTAPAYDILLTDLLTDSNLRLVAGSVTTTLGSIVTGNASGDTTLSISIGELALGSGVTITYQAQVLATTPPASLVSNAATAGYDSNPGPGGRPGDTGDETVTPVAPGFAKTIASTSNPDTGSGQFDPTAPDLAVGETLTYRLTITLPPGTTNELVLTDLLPQALLPIAARVATVGSGLTLGTPGITITGQAILLEFGTVTNGSGAAIGAEDVITVEVDARVIDIPGLPAGSSLVNAAALGFTIDGRTGSLTATAPADLVDPALTIDKTVNRLTGDAGDVFTYTVTVAQGPGSSADAYDIRVTDALDPRLILVSASSTDGTVGTAGNTVTLDLARFALNAAPVVLTYTVRMADTVEPGTVIGNTANLGWDSNPGPGGRPGTGTDSAPDLTAVFGLGLDKAIVATSLTGTTAGAIQPGVTDLAIGETVTYEIVARLSEGTQRVVISDTMPDGFLPISATVVTTGSSISAGLSGTLTPTATITGQAVGFDFGTLVNAGDNLSNAGDLVTVRITARVLDTAINATGRVATNDAQGVISSPTDPGAPGGTVTNQDSVPAAIVEPALDIAKAVDRSTGDAGDVFTYTLTLTTLPGATGPAYNVVIDDPLAAALIVVPGSLSASFGTATIIGNAIRVTIPELAPNAQPITITYQAAFADTIEPGQVVPNTATLAFTSAPTDGRTYGDSANAAVTGTFTFALDKAIVATSLTGTTAGAIQPGVTDLAIGETVTYELVARLSEGTQRLVIADTMPDGFLPITATVVTTGASISAGTGGTLTPTGTITGQGITFDFGTLVNAGDNVSNAGDLVTVRITARVLDISLNTAGRIATNDAEGTISAPTDPQAPGGTLTDGATVPAAIVEPALDIAKAVDRSTGDAGDVFTYTLTLTTLPGATGPAYNVVIDDPLAAALIVVPGSLSASFGTATIIGNAIRLTIPELAPNAQPITITYQAAFADTIEPGQVVPNTATLAFTSAPTDGRSYTDSAGASVTGSFTLGLDKAIVATSLLETTQGRIQPGTIDLAIGEVVTYELVARLSEGTQRLVVTDAMPAGLLPLATGTVVITTGGSISAGLGGTLAPTATITGQTVTFDFGTLVNRGDNVSDAGDLVTIRIAARVQDLPVNVEGRLLTNNAGATATAPTDPGAPGGTLTAADSVTAAVVIPRFDIAKAVDHTTGDAGEVFTYTLIIRPEAGNTGPAYNILVEDPLSPLLRAVPGSITTTAGTASLSGNTITISIPVLAADAAPVTITYQAAFTDALEPGQVVPNTAGLAFSTAPTDGRGFTDSASAAVRGVFTLALDKQVVATSLPETGSGYFNPALQDLAAGETVTYWLTATLSEGTQRLVITDTLPTGLTAEAARLVSLSPGIAAAAPAIALSAGSVTFDFGTIVNTGNNTTGDQVVVEVVARVGPGLSAPGTVLPNTATASVTAPGSPGAPGGTLTATDDAAVETVAAALVFDKSVGKPVLGLGESTTYTLVLSHAAGSTAPAYAVVLSDALSDASLALVTGSVTTTAGTITQGNNGGDTGVTVTLPILLPGETLTVTFLVRTIGIPIPDGIAPNTAVFDSTSAPGALPPGFGRPITGQDTAEVLIVSGGAPVLGTLLPGLDEGLRRLAFSPYAQPIILTGTAQPGATVTLGLSQAGIGPLGIGSTQADVGGNWLAILPEPIVPRFDEIAFQELREAVGRIPAYSWNLPSVTPLDGPAARGGEPYTFIASSTVSAANLGGTLGAPVSATFAGAIGPGGYFTGAAGALGGSPGMGLLGRAVDGAVGGDLAFNAYALDFLAAHVRAGALGR